MHYLTYTKERAKQGNENKKLLQNEYEKATNLYKIIEMISIELGLAR